MKVTRGKDINIIRKEQEECNNSSTDESVDDDNASVTVEDSEEVNIQPSKTISSVSSLSLFTFSSNHISTITIGRCTLPVHQRFSFRNRLMS